MSRIHKALACAALAAVLAACGSDASKSAEPASPKAAPDAKKVDAATAGTLAGRILFDGTAPASPVIATSSDPACSGGGDVRAESYVVDGGGLKNVFVYIKDGLGNRYLFDTPTTPVQIDQKGCHYVPHVVGLRATQPLEIVNSDSTLHNVHGMPRANREFNQGQPVRGMTNTFTFTSPEALIPLKCDVHAWMNAYVGVVDHPYFAVSGDGGRFELRTVPPGTYTIEAVHEKLGRQTQTVTLGEKDTKEITFTFKPTATQ